MNALNRAMLAVSLGLGLAVLLIEASARLIELPLASPPILALLANGALAHSGLLITLGLIALLAGAAGGAVAAAISACPLLALPVGLACGLSLSFTAWVGVQPAPSALALGLMPVLGALLAARSVSRLRRLDGAA